ncbi:MAG: hypothetical protein ABWZ57_04195 [Mesorhizobium sp.]
MHLAALIASLAVAAALPASAVAQETDRYTLERSGDGYVRMDRRTGEMSICSERSGQLVCKIAADERSAFQDEVDRLQERLAGLEKRVAELETVRRIDPEALLPTDEQFEKSLGYMERFFRRFMDIVRDFDKDWLRDAPPSEPQKT